MRVARRDTPAWLTRLVGWWAALVIAAGVIVLPHHAASAPVAAAGAATDTTLARRVAQPAAATTTPPGPTVPAPEVTVPAVTAPTVTLPPVTIPPVTLPPVVGDLVDPNPVSIDASGLWFVDAGAGTASRVLSGMAVQGASFAPDGRRVAFTAHETDNFDGRVPTLLGVLDLDTGAVARLAPDARTPQAVAWSPDGQWIAFSQFPDPAVAPATGGDLWVVRPDGSDARKIAPCDGGWGMRWSPDSRSVLQARPNEHDVMVADIASGETRVYPAEHILYAEWADGGATIVASGTDVGTVRIDRDSGAVTPLSSGHYARPAPDGRWLATSTGGAGARVELGGLAGIVRDIGAGVPVDWAPDSAWLSFTPHTGAVHVADATSGHAWVSAVGAGVELSPTVWSPVGRGYLVIASTQTAFYAP